MDVRPSARDRLLLSCGGRLWLRQRMQAALRRLAIAA
jgi:hypothetical protein